MTLGSIVREVLLERSFRFDPNSTEGQGRYRLKDPDLFKRVWTRRDPDAKGVTHIIGIMHDGRYGTQAIRFNRDVWAEGEAAKWWSKNAARFRRTWRAKDWKGRLDEGKPFLSKSHDWSQLIIDREGERWTRGQIRDHYKRVGPKLLRTLRGHDAIVILGMGRNRFVLKRNRDEQGTRIRIDKLSGIDDPTSLEYWINRRAVEFHIALHGTRTDVAWVDIDIHKPKNLSRDRARARAVVSKVSRVLRREVGGAISTWDSGRTGFHVMSNLREEEDVNALRKGLKKTLDAEFEDRDDVTTKIAKPGQIRLDVTTLKRTGSLRAPYSLSVYGRVKKPIGGAK
jgi:DNA primase